jgi:N-acetylmuramoyl-L-alanine amidase
MLSMLTRYKLHSDDCNLKKFIQLNKLNAKDKLVAGKTYALPITKVLYNGVSIRKTLNINSIEQAIAIQEFNDWAKKKKLRADDFRESRQLWVAWHQLDCNEKGEVEKSVNTDTNTVKAIGPNPGSGGRIFPVFGDQYAYTPLVDDRLKGKVFYIVSGHGGLDSGASGKRGTHTLCEDEYAYDVALRLTRLLISHGATTYMIVRDPNDGIRDADYLICDTDEVLWGNKPTANGQKARLQDRCDVINELTVNFTEKGISDQTLIEIHVDSRSKSARTDVFFYYRPSSISSANMANRLQETFELKYAKVRAGRRYQGTVSARGLFMLTETKTPKAVYIELGNIRNPYDQLRLVTPRNRQLLAQWMFDGVSAKD